MVNGDDVSNSKKWVGKLFGLILSLFSLNFSFILVLFFYWLLSISLSLYLLKYSKKRILLKVNFSLGFIFVFLMLIFTFRYKQLIIEKHAVVVGDEVSARFEPFDRATVFFTLNQGHQIQILKKRGGWMKVKKNNLPL